MRRALLQLNAAVFLWGFTGVLGREITLSATWLVWYRLLITALSLWLLYGVLGWVRRLPVRTAVYIMGIGLVQALHWVLFYASIKLSNVTIALTCLSTSALMASLLEPLILRRRADPLEVLLGFCALGGIAVIYGTHLEFSSGILVGLLSTLLTVIVSVLNKGMVDDVPPEGITLYQLSGGFLGISLLLPLYLHLFPDPARLPGGADWLWLFILSWVCTILTFFLYIRSLKKVSAFTMNLLLTLEPVYGILLAFWIYREDRLLSPAFYAGFGLITLSVVLHIGRLLRKPAT